MERAFQSYIAEVLMQDNDGIEEEEVKDSPPLNPPRKSSFVSYLAEDEDDGAPSRNGFVGWIQ